MTLTEFMLARIAEDEAVARAASRLPYEGLSWADHVLSSERDTTPAMDAFVERHDPARVLAECAAKRRIVELHNDALEAELNNRDASAFGADLMYRDVIRALASVYAGHPDYRQEWTL